MRHRIICGSDCIIVRAFRSLHTTRGSARVGLSWLSLKITLFEQDVSSCQNAVGYRPCSAQLHSEDLCLWCAQIQNSGEGVKGSRNLSLTFHTSLDCAADKKWENALIAECYTPICNTRYIDCDKQRVKTPINLIKLQLLLNLCQHKSDIPFPTLWDTKTQVNSSTVNSLPRGIIPFHKHAKLG